MADYSHILKKCFVNAPFPRLVKDLDLFLKHKINPEIGLEGDVLYTCEREEFSKMAKVLEDAGLSCTLHAPFFDLMPGALDPYILQATRNKLQRAFELTEIFRPKSVVCHLNFEDNKHIFKQDEWLQTSLATWRGLLDIAKNQQTPLMLENTYETGATHHEQVLTALDSPYARFCLDVGHTQTFAQNEWQDWLPQLSPWLGQLHLHDNDRSKDAHLAPGKGTFDFAGLFAYLEQEKLYPIITLEPHTEEDLWQSLESLEQMQLLKNFPDIQPN